MLISTQPKVKVFFVCPQEYKNHFASSHCILAISVGHRKHEGRSLYSTLAKINKTFGKCSIMLADTLQRYNLKYAYPSLDWPELYELSKQAGDEWIKRNAEAISTLTIPHGIIRWDNWLAHEDYKACRERVDILYDKKEDFGMSVFKTIQDLALRLDKKNSRQNCLSLFKWSLEYIKEECAAQLLMAKGDFDFILYPGAYNQAMGNIYHSLIQPESSNKFKWIDLKIKH